MTLRRNQRGIGGVSVSSGRGSVAAIPTRVRSQEIPSIRLGGHYFIRPLVRVNGEAEAVVVTSRPGTAVHISRDISAFRFAVARRNTRAGLLFTRGIVN